MRESKSEKLSVIDREHKARKSIFETYIQEAIILSHSPNLMTDSLTSLQLIFLKKKKKKESIDKK